MNDNRLFKNIPTFEKLPADPEYGCTYVCSTKDMDETPKEIQGRYVWEAHNGVCFCRKKEPIDH